MLTRFLIVAVLALAAAGCGGDDEGGEPAAPASGTTTGAETTAPPGTEAAPPAETEQRERQPGRERTPRSLAACLRDADGIEEVLVKGDDSEDATFFTDLAGGHVDVLGVTVAGEATELTVALFETPAAAEKAAPNAGGGGVDATPIGAALVLAPPGAARGGVEECLRATRYATG